MSRRARRPAGRIFRRSRLVCRAASMSHRTRLHWLRRTIAAAKKASSPCAKGSVRITPRSSRREARPGGPDSRRSIRSNGARSRNAATTCSFSSGSLEQVAYTRRPPGRHGRGRARQQIDLLVGETRQIARSRAPANIRIAADRAQARAGRIDEHAIECVREWQRAAGRHVDDVQRGSLRFCARSGASSATRPARTSQATSVPESFMLAAIATVFPPGDAQRSRIRSRGCASTTRGTSCDASS